MQPMPVAHSDAQDIREQNRVAHTPVILRLSFAFKQATLNDTVVSQFEAKFNVVLAALGRLEEAVAASHVALKLDPHQPDSYNNLGVLLMQLGQWDAAADCYRQAIALAPHGTPHG